MAPALLIFAISLCVTSAAITIAEAHAFGLIHPPEVICIFVHDNNGVDDDDDDGNGVSDYDDDDDSGKKYRPSYSSLLGVFEGAKLLIQPGPQLTCWGVDRIKIKSGVGSGLNGLIKALPNCIVSQKPLLFLNVSS